MGAWLPRFVCADVERAAERDLVTEEVMVQWPAEDLKTETSRTPVPIPQSLALELSAHVAQWPGETVLTGRDGAQLPPWALERAIRTARARWTASPPGSGTTTRGTTSRRS